MTNEIANLPKGWVRTNLTAIAEVIRGVSFPKDQKSSLPQEGFLGCLRTTNVQREVEWNDMLFVPRRFIRRHEQLVRLNDILISTANSLELVGKVALIRAVPLVTTIGAFIAVIRVHPDINPKFVYFQITSSDIQSYFRQRASTTTNISNISTSNVLNSFLGIPPLPEQHRIVATIEELFARLDAGVEALKKIKAQLKRYRQSILKHAFEGKLTAEWRQAHKHELEPASALLDRIRQERKKDAERKYEELSPLDTSDLAQLPEGWAWARVGEITSVMSGGTPDTKDELNFGGDVVWITPADLSGWDDKYISHGARNITDRGLKSSSAVLLPKGSVIFSSRAPIGYVAIAATELCTNQGFKNFIPFDGLYNEYLYYYLKASKSLAESFASGTTFSELSASRAANLPVPFPPTSEQHRIMEEIERRFSVADRIEKTVDHSLKQAERLRQSILKRAFEGKLVPHDPNDEPAEKLLERIREQRAKEVAEKRVSVSRVKRRQSMDGN